MSVENSLLTGTTLRREDALIFLDTVKQQLANKPGDYNAFLNVLKELQEEKVNINCAISEICTLFQGHPDLIQGFSAFLPPGVYLPR